MRVWTAGRDLVSRAHVVSRTACPGPAAVATARKAGKVIRATLVAFALLSAASAPVVGQPKPFDPDEEEEALQVVAVLVVHARECSSNRE
jgi:hypothetical protein